MPIKILPFAPPIKDVLLSTADAATFLLVSTVFCTVSTTFKAEVNKDSKNEKIHYLIMDLPLAVPINEEPLSTTDAAAFFVESTVLYTVFATLSKSNKEMNKVSLLYILR